ncbi:MAG: response regulator [Lachnospiraceae bacterium]|nr:response regulator [Lachnospiraceae bacterium]
MYTVLLVDDESNTLETLSTHIHWQQFGVDTVLTASDGRQALDIMSKQKTDLLITDIKMPHMDGLTLLTEVRLYHPETHCILLTAYGEFEYARQAIQLGVENYLLKPLQKEELEETIEIALDNIYTNREISRQLFRNNILLRWVSGNISGEELSERASLLNINLYLPEYCVVCISKKTPSVSLSSFCKTCTKKLQDFYEVHHFKDDHKRWVFIIGGSRIIPAQIINCFSEEANKINLNHMITISVGNTMSAADHLPESYLSAVNLLDCSDLSTFEMIITAAPPNSETEADRLTQELNSLFHCYDEKERQNGFHTLAHKLLSENPNSSTQTSLTFISHSLTKLFSQSFPKHVDALEQLHARIRMQKTNSRLESAKSDIIEILEYSHLLFQYYLKQMSPVIQSAINYIHSRYAENISIQDFCNKNKMSSPYLGYLFKKETGMFFNNYLMQHRICCSILLLLDTDLKISDIAKKTGFSSTSYYITCFKKQTGLSPTNYRINQT